MSFVRANPPGWALFELLLSSQLNTIDSQMPFALDGRDGGSYTPSAGITLALISVNSGSPPAAGFEVVGHANTGGEGGPGALLTGGIGNANDDGGVGLLATGGATTGSTNDGGVGLRAIGGAITSGSGDGGVGMSSLGGGSAAGNGGQGVLTRGGVPTATGTVGGVGIDNLAEQQLGPYHDDFCFHFAPF